MTVNKNWTFKTREYKKGESKNRIKEQGIMMFLQGAVKIVKMVDLSLLVERYVFLLAEGLWVEIRLLFGAWILARLYLRQKKRAADFLPSSKFGIFICYGLSYLLTS